MDVLVEALEKGTNFDKSGGKGATSLNWRTSIAQRWLQIHFMQAPRAKLTEINQLN